MINLNKTEIENLLPHRDPMLLIDELNDIKKLTSATGIVNVKKEEKLKVDKFKISDEDFKNKEKKILAKKNLVTNEEINKELRSLNVEFQNYRKNKIKEIDELKAKRKRNILNFIKLINPIIEKYMSDNSIAILLDKKNIFIASKNYDITKNLVTLIDKDIKSIDIE